MERNQRNDGQSRKVHALLIRKAELVCTARARGTSSATPTRRKVQWRSWRTNVWRILFVANESSAWDFSDDLSLLQMYKQYIFWIFLKNKKNKSSYFVKFSYLQLWLNWSVRTCWTWSYCWCDARQPRTAFAQFLPRVSHTLTEQSANEKIFLTIHTITWDLQLKIIGLYAKNFICSLLLFNLRLYLRIKRIHIYQILYKIFVR